MPCLKCHGNVPFILYDIYSISDELPPGWLCGLMQKLQLQLQWAKNIFKLCIINLVKIVSLSCKVDMTWVELESGEGGVLFLPVNIFYAGGKRKARNLHSNWRVSDVAEQIRGGSGGGRGQPEGQKCWPGWTSEETERERDDLLRCARIMTMIMHISLCFRYVNYAKLYSFIKSGRYFW